MERDKINCNKCGSKNIVKKGKRKNKYETVQKYFCNSCSKYLVFKKLKNKVYPSGVIIHAIGHYNLGYSLDKSSKLINKKFISAGDEDFRLAEGDSGAGSWKRG